MRFRLYPPGLAFALALAGCGSGGATAPSAVAASPVDGSNAVYNADYSANASCALAYVPPVATPPAGLAFCAKLATKPDANGRGSEEGKSCQARGAIDIVKEMGQGWNLGNTLDAFGNTSSSLADETTWGAPRTTAAMIETVRQGGFTTLRLPVSWDDHFSGAARGIDPVWMNRVEEVANLALAKGMTVILNIHHNQGWETPTAANEQVASETLRLLWTQIAKRFQQYDHHLVFEVMNEPRVILGGVDDWIGKTEHYEVLNRLNATALATIRATGGNNARRLLMLPSYAAATGERQLAPMLLPSDPMIALSSHAYLPYDFALNQKGSAIFTQQGELDEMFARLNARFIAKGVPVVMGEWASQDKGNLGERVKHSSYYVKSARQLGIPTMWWDNHATGARTTAADVMGLLDRNNNTWVYPEIKDAIFCAAQ